MSQVRRWPQQRRWRETLRLSLNVTATDLAEARFRQHDRCGGRRGGLSARTADARDHRAGAGRRPRRSADRLRQLADLGIRIALDDFGAGFCNFGYLKRLPLHYLKLDRSMVEGIDENPRDLAVLRGILSMALALGLEVIAEGVERESQREAVACEGCAAWQGFLGARPMTAVEFVNLTICDGRSKSNRIRSTTTGIEHC